MRQRLIAAVALLATSAGVTVADDRMHTYADATGKTITTEWWQTMASCAGRLKVLSGWAVTQSKPEVKALEERTTMFWLLSVHRLKKDRGINEDDAARLALASAQSMAQIQEQGINVYSAAGKMDAEYQQKLAVCEDHLNAYAAAFPEDFGGKQ